MCSPPSVMLSTKDLSTLRMSAGQVRRRLSEECPVPKSSSAMLTPSAAIGVQRGQGGAAVEDGRFGDFDGEQSCRHAGALQDGREVGGEIGLA